MRRRVFQTHQSVNNGVCPGIACMRIVGLALLLMAVLAFVGTSLLAHLGNAASDNLVLYGVAYLVVMIVALAGFAALRHRPDRRLGLWRRKSDADGHQ